MNKEESLFMTWSFTNLTSLEFIWRQIITLTDLLDSECKRSWNPRSSVYTWAAVTHPNWVIISLPRPSNDQFHTWEITGQATVKEYIATEEEKQNMSFLRDKSLDH